VHEAPAPIAVRMVVVANFENGADTGDKPGEYQCVGSPVVHELLAIRTRYRGTVPGSTVALSR